MKQHGTPCILIDLHESGENLVEEPKGKRIIWQQRPEQKDLNRNVVVLGIADDVEIRSYHRVLMVDEVVR